MKKLFHPISVFFLCHIISLISYSQDGSLDLSFNQTDVGFGQGWGVIGAVGDMAVQDDGKILIGGEFSRFNNALRIGIARLNADGSLDDTFKTGIGADGGIYSIAIQSDKKILIGGRFSSYNGIFRSSIARLNVDGSLDVTFNPGTAVGNLPGSDRSVNSIALQSDGKILIGGIFSNYNGIARKNIARLNVDGSLDQSFNPGAGVNGSVSAIVIQPDKNVLIAGSFTSYNNTARNYIARLNEDGGLDGSFNSLIGANSAIRRVVLLSDGKILIGGGFTSYGGVSRNRIARLNSSGSIDTSFNRGSGANGPVVSINVLSDGKMLIGGFFTEYSGSTSIYLARINTDGTIDGDFNCGSGTNMSVQSIAVQTNGKILISGGFTEYDGRPQNGIARVNSDGRIDDSFNPGSGANREILSITMQKDGKLLVGGSFTGYNGELRNRIARLNVDGGLDKLFNPGTGANGSVYSIAVQQDGKVIVGGYFMTFHGSPRNCIARLNPGGSLDASFNPGIGADGRVASIMLQPDGKILIGGYFSKYNGISRNSIARLNTDGSLDASFNPGTGANGIIETIALQANGKILIGGEFSKYNGVSRNVIARLNSDGSLDSDFIPATGSDSILVYQIAVQSDGKILVGGDFTRFNSNFGKHIVRLNTDGSMDHSFNVDAGMNGSVRSIAIQSDGRVLIGGSFTRYVTLPRSAIARLNSDGSLDASFNPGTGANGDIQSIVLQPDGKILIGGWFTGYNGTGRNSIARLQSMVTFVNDPQSRRNIRIYPNPTADALHVEMSFQPQVRTLRYELIDRQGRRLRSGFFTDTHEILSMNGMAQGYYVIYLYQGSRLVRSEKILHY